MKKTAARLRRPYYLTFKPTGKPAEYTLMDQIWLSPSLAPKLTSAFIEQRTKAGGDGTDHDPHGSCSSSKARRVLAYIELALSAIAAIDNRER